MSDNDYASCKSNFWQTRFQHRLVALRVPSSLHEGNNLPQECYLGRQILVGTGTRANHKILRVNRLLTCPCFLVVMEVQETLWQAGCSLQSHKAN